VTAGVSVLFNEPKLLKYTFQDETGSKATTRFSALQRAEIAEIAGTTGAGHGSRRFQCSSTSRNC